MLKLLTLLGLLLGSSVLGQYDALGLRGEIIGWRGPGNPYDRANAPAEATRGEAVAGSETRVGRSANTLGRAGIFSSPTISPLLSNPSTDPGYKRGLYYPVAKDSSIALRVDYQNSALAFVCLDGERYIMLRMNPEGTGSNSKSIQVVWSMSRYAAVDLSTWQAVEDDLFATMPDSDLYTFVRDAKTNTEVIVTQLENQKQVSVFNLKNFSTLLTKLKCF